MPVRKESDLYAPLRKFLERRGYEVRGEVEGCDLVAVRGDKLVVVELKRRFNLGLVLQGVDRQQLTDTVYLAVEAPRRRRGGSMRWDLVQRLCRKLGLGLITVVFSRRRACVTVELDPAPYRPRKNLHRRAGLLDEFQQRTADYNVGGSNGRPIVTAYREEALRVAAELQRSGPSRVRHVRETADSKKAGSILYKNVYGWFERVAHGIYGLTPEGRQALETYADVVAGRNSVPLPSPAITPPAADQTAA